MLIVEVVGFKCCLNPAVEVSKGRGWLDALHSLLGLLKNIQKRFFHFNLSKTETQNWSMGANQSTSIHSEGLSLMGGSNKAIGTEARQWASHSRWTPGS